MQGYGSRYSQNDEVEVYDENWKLVVCIVGEITEDTIMYDKLENIIEFDEEGAIVYVIIDYSDYEDSDYSDDNDTYYEWHLNHSD